MQLSLFGDMDDAPKVPRPQLTIVPPTLPLDALPSRIITGDCLEEMCKLPDHSVNCIIVDPPYYRVAAETWDRQWDTAAGFLVWIAQLRDQWYRLLKPNGSLYVFASPRMAARVECNIGERFNVLNQIRWVKRLHSAWKMSRDAQRSYLSPNEHIIFAEHHGADTSALGLSGYGAKCDELRGFVFEPIRAYLDGERIRAKMTIGYIRDALGFRGNAPFHWFAVNQHLGQDSQWQLPKEEQYTALQRIAPGYFLQPYETLRQQYETLRRPFAVTEHVPYTDVWTFAAVPPRKGRHPCEKPLPLLEHIITTSTRPNDIILDCCCGTGATCVAAEKLGRRFIGIDREAKYTTIAQQRIQKQRRKGLWDVSKDVEA